MGFYINPKDGSSKEDWLKAHGTALSSFNLDMWDHSGKQLPVCLVDNGFFTAAGIAYCPREAEEFMRPDGRPKQWYLVPTEALQDYL